MALGVTRDGRGAGGAGGDRGGPRSLGRSPGASACLTLTGARAPGRDGPEGPRGSQPGSEPLGRLRKQRIEGSLWRGAWERGQLEGLRASGERRGPVSAIRFINLGRWGERNCPFHD